MGKSARTTEKDVITVRVDVTLKRRIERAAEMRRCSVSDLVRETLEKIAPEEKPDPILSGEFVSRVPGPKDGARKFRHQLYESNKP